MSKPLIINPAFAVPLNGDELYLLGLAAVLWGQTDYLIDEILMFAQGFDADQRSMFLTDKPMGGKADMLAKVIDRLPEEVQADARAFHKYIQAVKQRRNSAFHGLWGWRWEKRSKTRQVAAWHHTTLDNPVRPSQLRKLVEDMIDGTKIGGRVASRLRGLEYGEAVQFTWGPWGDEGPEAWLGQSGLQFRKGLTPQDRRK